MIVKAKFGTYAESWRKLTQEGWDALREAIPGLEKETKPEHHYDEHFMDYAAICLCARLGLELDFQAGENTMLVKLQNRAKEAGLSTGSSDAALVAAGAMVQIHVPNLGLMLIDEATNLDDCCTDELQRHLNDGWRILAVCPPNAQRRPDYILGRTKVRKTD